MAIKTKAIEIARGSGNVFADLGFPDPESERFKATLMLQICRVIRRRNRTSRCPMRTAPRDARCGATSRSR